MTTDPFRIAIAARYAERQTIRQFLDAAQLTNLPVTITASWLSATAEQDADLTDDQAEQAALTNWKEIRESHLLLYFSCWQRDIAIRDAKPLWSPGRLIDLGMALACRVPVLVVGERETSIYFRQALVSVCERTPLALYRAIKGRVR